jgi:prolyl oligopeptidase
VFDLIGALRGHYGFVACAAEFCDPREPEEIRRMARFSPYQLVRDGTAYPAVFVVAGDTDPRCPPWHARKFAARLQAATSSDAPVLLHVFENEGHGWATDKDVAIDQATEWLAFVMQQLGLAPEPI